MYLSLEVSILLLRFSVVFFVFHFIDNNDKQAQTVWSDTTIYVRSHHCDKINGARYDITSKRKGLCQICSIFNELKLKLITNQFRVLICYRHSSVIRHHVCSDHRFVLVSFVCIFVLFCYGLVYLFFAMFLFCLWFYFVVFFIYFFTFVLFVAYHRSSI